MSGKLWLLRPREDLSKTDNPWEPWYNRAFGFVVRAETEAEARRMPIRGKKHSRHDGTSFYMSETGDEIRGQVDVWTDRKYTTCTELTNEGEPGIIIRDFASA